MNRSILAIAAKLLLTFPTCPQTHIQSRDENCLFSGICVAVSHCFSLDLQLLDSLATGCVDPADKAWEVGLGHI
jgi:hypothetical protein